MTRQEARVTVLKYLMSLPDIKIRHCKQIQKLLGPEYTVGWTKKKMAGLSRTGPVFMAFKVLVGKREDSEALFLSYSPRNFGKPVTRWQSIYRWLADSSRKMMGWVDSMPRRHITRLFKSPLFYGKISDGTYAKKGIMAGPHGWTGVLYSLLGEVYCFLNGKAVDSETYTLASL